MSISWAVGGSRKLWNCERASGPRVWDWEINRISISWVWNPVGGSRKLWNGERAPAPRSVHSARCCTRTKFCNSTIMGPWELPRAVVFGRLGAYNAKLVAWGQRCALSCGVLSYPFTALPCNLGWAIWRLRGTSCRIVIRWNLSVAATSWSCISWSPA